MKITVSKKELNAALAVIKPAICKSHNSAPILQNCLIDAASDGKITLAATDLDTCITVIIDGEVTESGQVTVSAKALTDATKKGKGTVILETSGEYQLAIEYRMFSRMNGAQLSLPTLPAQDYPAIPQVSEESIVSIPAADLSRGLSSVFYATNKDTYDLFSPRGVFLQPHEAKLRFVGTDGHRVAQYDVSHLDCGKIGENVIIGNDAVRAIITAIGADAGPDTMIQLATGKTFDTRSFKASANNWAVYGRLLDEEFPDYAGIFPNTRSALTFDKSVLVPALDQMKAVTDINYQHVYFRVGKGKFEMEAGNPEKGTAKLELPVDWHGDKVKIAYNVRYVLEAIAAMGKAQRVTWKWLDGEHGGLFAAPDNDNYLALIMPMIV